MRSSDSDLYGDEDASSYAKTLVTLLLMLLAHCGSSKNRWRDTRDYQYCTSEL